jgi:hypothetical protein
MVGMKNASCGEWECERVYGVKSGHHAPATVTAMMARRSTPRRGAFISIQSKTQVSIQETIAPSKLYSISVCLSQLASE